MRDKLLGNLLVNGYNYITKVNIKKKPIVEMEMVISNTKTYSTILTLHKHH
jgi:hypothetical protein